MNKIRKCALFSLLFLTPKCVLASSEQFGIPSLGTSSLTNEMLHEQSLTQETTYPLHSAEEYDGPLIIPDKWHPRILAFIEQHFPSHGKKRPSRALLERLIDLNNSVYEFLLEDRDFNSDEYIALQLGKVYSSEIEDDPPTGSKNTKARTSLKFRTKAEIEKDFLENHRVFPQKSYYNDPLFEKKKFVVNKCDAILYEVGKFGSFSDDTRYVVKELLGKGGYGDVFLVQFTTKEGRSFQLAIKQQILHPDEKYGSIFNELLYLEGMSEAHPNSVPYFGCVQIPLISGAKYLIGMDRMAGTWVAEKEKNQATKRRLMKEAFRALTALHETGNVHYDLKAENFLIRESGETCIADYGLSRPVQNGMLCSSNSYGAYVPHEAEYSVDLVDIPLDSREPFYIRFDPRCVDVFAAGLACLDLCLDPKQHIHQMIVSSGSLLKEWDKKWIVNGDQLKLYLESFDLFSDWNEDVVALLFSMTANYPWHRPTMAFVLRQFERF